jgi:acyl-CoA synthetase (NDP forming)
MKLLTEKEAEDFLEKEGFKVTKREFIKNKSELANITKKISFPWVMKISSRHIVHKTKIGGTMLDIKNIEQAESAFDKLKTIKGFEGILVQEFIKGKELILGLKKTPEFDIVIMFGKGGTNVEQEKDISFRIPPIDEKEAENMLKEIKFYKNLKKVNMKKIKQNIIKLSKLTEKFKNIQELDINPLIANKNEAIVVDSRISFE